MQDIVFEEWLDEETHEDGVEIMNESAVVPFGTALWP